MSDLLPSMDGSGERWIEASVPEFAGNATMADAPDYRLRDDDPSACSAKPFMYDPNQECGSTAIVAGLPGAMTNVCAEHPHVDKLKEAGRVRRRLRGCAG
jgi:hypothetical protein